MVVATQNGHMAGAGVPEFLLPEHDVVLRDFGGAFAGVEVRIVRRMSVTDALHWYAIDKQYVDDEHADLAYWQRMKTLFQHILGWNLVQRVKDEDGDDVLGEDGRPLTEPIPVTLDSVLGLPWDLAEELSDKFTERLQEVAALPVPLSSASTNGSPLQAQPEPTEPSSESRRSSSRRKRKTA